MKSWHGALLGLALAAGGTVLLTSCGGAKAPTYPGAPIILISIDTLRSDHLPAYGYHDVSTPAIDALRADGILCERAFSHYPMTLPSHASILTGLLPPAHGVRDNVGYRLDGAKHPTLAALLKAAGYTTGGAVSSYVLRHGTGISSGFDFYEDSVELHPGDRLDDVQRPGGETLKKGLEWLRGQNGKPTFFFLHLYEPHTPYTPPEPWRSIYSARPYDGEIAAADALVGELVADLKHREIYDQAIIVLLSDHGEGLSEHGERTHGIFLYREALQVPLLIKLPGSARKGATIAAPVELIDVAPTILKLAGVTPPREMTGLSLLSLLNGPAPQRQIYSETFYPRLHLGWSELASLVGTASAAGDPAAKSGEVYHYIEGPDPELYDLQSDAAEKTNLRERERRSFAALRAALKSYDRTLAVPDVVDTETARKLASLGYLAGASAATGKGALPDPKSQLPALSLIEGAFLHIQAGEDAQAVTVFRSLLAKNPQMVDMWGFLALTLQRLGRHGEAIPAFEEALKLSHGLPSIAVAAAGSYLALGRLDDAQARGELAMKGNPTAAYEVLVQVALDRHDSKGALALMKKAVDDNTASAGLRQRYLQLVAAEGSPEQAIANLRTLADKGDAEAGKALAQALSNAGRQPEAEALLTRQLAATPNDARALELLGMVLLRRERPAEARDQLKRSLELDPKSASGWNTLGVALATLGDSPAGIAAWKKAVALDPTFYEALLNIGISEGQLGHRTEALKALRQFLATAPADQFAEDRAQARGLLREYGG